MLVAAEQSQKRTTISRRAGDPSNPPTVAVTEETRRVKLESPLPWMGELEEL